MDDEIDQVRRELRRTVLAARICAGLCLAAFILALVVGCASPDRQWSESQTALENLPR